MFPGVYGFTWDAGNLIFLGLFFCVAVVIASTVTLAAVRAARDLRRHREEAIRWQEDFHDLPEPLRRCRHELSGALVRLSLDCGFPLIALITRMSFEELKLEVGKTVFASFKATAIHVITAK